MVTLDTLDFVPFELNEAKKTAAQILQSARTDNLSTCFGQTFIVRYSNQNHDENDLSEQLLNFLRKERKRYAENVLFKFPTESLELEQSDFGFDLTLIIDDLVLVAGQFKADLVLNEHIKQINGTYQDIQYLSRRNLELRKQLDEVTIANLDNCEKMIDLRMEITNEKSEINKKLLRSIVVIFFRKILFTLQSDKVYNKIQKHKTTMAA